MRTLPRMEPVIITNSISGAVANREQCPAIPYTPEEYGAEARRAVEEGAVEIIGRSAIEASDDPDATREAMLNAVREQIDPYIAAGNAVIDDVIDPRETRPTIIAALRMARDKHIEKPRKRHGVMPV